MATNLKIQNQKIELIQWLSTIEDNSILEKLLALKQQENEDWFLSLSNAETNSIEHGLADADAGKLNPHSKAKRLYEKWL